MPVGFQVLNPKFGKPSLTPPEALPADWRLREMARLPAFSVVPKCDVVSASNPLNPPAHPSRIH